MEPHENKDDRDRRVGRELEAYLEELARGKMPDHEDLADPESRELAAIVNGLHQMSMVLSDSLPPDDGENQSNSDDSARAPVRIGKYEITGLLGSGGQSAAFIARDPTLERKVVIKLYHTIRSEVDLESILREGRYWSRISCPHVAHCYGADVHEGVPYLILEYIDGDPLSRSIKQPHWNLSETLRVIEECCRGLASIHQAKLVHGDIKPGNIVLGEDGRARIIDFGLATTMSHSSGRVSGTAAYMPPEIASGKGSFNSQSDLFSLGATMYECLTGRAPFAGESRETSLANARRAEFPPLSQLAPNLPIGVEQACLKCLAPNPDDRFETIEAFSATIRQQQSSHDSSGFSARMLLTLALAVCLATSVAKLLPLNSHSPRSRSPNATVDQPNEEDRHPAVSVGLRAIPQDLPTIDHKLPTLLRNRKYDDFQLRVSLSGVRWEESLGLFVIPENSELRLQLHPDVNCYVGVWSWDRDSAVQLFPNQWESSTFVEAEDRRRIPGDAAIRAMMLRTSYSGRTEFLHIAAGTDVWFDAGKDSPFETEKYPQYHSPDELAFLKSELRGLEARRRPGVQKVSEIVIPYLVTRANAHSE